MLTRSFLYLTLLGIGGLLVACSANSESRDIRFAQYTITEDAQLWWAWDLTDVNADGITDVVVQHNNGSGGWLGWYEGQRDPAQSWPLQIVADSLEDGRRFAAGDLDTGDFDNDGDIDLLGVVHPGEWTDAGAPADLFWFENPTWQRHPIGQIPDALKDVNLADLDNDGRLDVLAITFEESYLTIFQQEATGAFAIAQQIQITNLHEGMDVCDLNGDGFLDIATNGYWLANPTGPLTDPWPLASIDSVWHSQDGDWSRNATKVACADLDGNDRPEVLIAHSERTGYPLARYRLVDATTNSWDKEIVLDSLVAAHSLQVADFDLDGALDILTGVNRSRAEDLDVHDHPVYVVRNGASGWDTLRVHSGGIYNAQVEDYEGDGDFDLFRYPTHNDTVLQVLVNQVISE
jgi:hypothetical protein